MNIFPIQDRAYEPPDSLEHARMLKEKNQREKRTAIQTVLTQSNFKPHEWHWGLVLGLFELQDSHFHHTGCTMQKTGWQMNKCCLLPSTRASRNLSNSASLLTASSDTFGALGKHTTTTLMLSRLPWLRKKKMVCLKKKRQFTRQKSNTVKQVFITPHTSIVNHYKSRPPPFSPIFTWDGNLWHIFIVRH